MYFQPEASIYTYGALPTAVLSKIYSQGWGKWGGARGAMALPPIKFSMMLFFVVNCNLFYNTYYVKEAGAVIAGFYCLFYNKILLNLT